MEQVYDKKKDCCGCSACYNICPTDAIEMIADEEGFLYPLIDQDLCIDCYECRDVCPYIQEGHFKEESEPDFYVAKHKDVSVLKKSTSGGAFTSISDIILSQGGVVYGVDFDDDFKVLHKRTESIEGRNRMRISKYVQSDLGTIFQEIKRDIENEKNVLFTGTPCQNAGLRGYMGGSTYSENLYLCDLICHSIPSPLVWEDYKRLLEKEHGGILTDIHFRSKIIDWTRENSNKSFLYKTSSSDETYNDERYYQLFFGLKTITRPACANCKFTDIHRASDITIADYWGIEKYAPEWMDTMGVSVLLINTKKGQELLDSMNDSMHYEKRPAQESLNEQMRLSEPVEFPDYRSQFWEDYQEYGFDYIIEQLEKAEG